MISIEEAIYVISSSAFLITAASFVIHFYAFSRLIVYYKSKHHKEPFKKAAQILKFCQLLYTSFTGLLHITRSDIYLSFSRGTSPYVGYTSAVARGFFLFQIYLCYTKPDIFQSERIFVGLISLLLFLGSTGVALTKRHQFHIVVIMTSNLLDLASLYISSKLKRFMEVAQLFPILLLLYILQAHFFNSKEYKDTYGSLMISALLLTSWFFRFWMKFRKRVKLSKEVKKSAEELL